MRILGHIHTFNDEDVIERSLQALLEQSHPVDEILIVDNGSTDGTLQKTFPEKVTVIHHSENLGTSGAVVTGMRYALDKGYDWIWLFDADSAPRKDALQKLLDLYRSFGPDLQDQVWLVASLPVDARTAEPWHGTRFGSKGPKCVQPDPKEQFYDCDVAMWTGSLYSLTAVRKVGLPQLDYVLDTGEGEYGYRGKRCGYRAFMHLGSIVDHNIDNMDAARFSSHSIGPLSFNLLELAPNRWYYAFRNTVYFWLYEYHEHNIYHVLRESSSFPSHIIKFVVLSRWPQLKACLRGLWDGFFKNMHHRY